METQRGPDDRAPGVDDKVEGDQHEGSAPAAGTPPIGDDAVAGQTQSPAPADDVGVPPDDELGEPDEA